MSSCLTTLLVHLPSCSQTDQGQGVAAPRAAREAGLTPDTAAQPGSTPPPASDMDPHFLPSDWSADAAPTTAPDAGRVRELMGGVAGHLP